MSTTVHVLFGARQVGQTLARLQLEAGFERLKGRPAALRPAHENAHENRL
jgi:hypothetical protein